ncbi:flagellar filament capping protein FliD [Microbacterium imperiale]|uniref:Flagellar hook-associated protein 2 n=1 Tax=Microbacterium imperiale TaxID=33884 RepID=A0A9W6HGK4_9MICO|nr:flagellar filament capping protein FliD [Microbacterium imperiale]MBP2420916.1 flagellar hook-associated protein 2 [Microbacterium imperiale]MDS0199969.1 flagellar filament capping protein FliD [Microbacterium imperiale]BFE41258.1 flagellar filament capping protein FliD [Microbacterium imperiale]GLJ80209.1 flagellar hook-associated protein 2 [Microbacterium imperiale]
MAISIGGLASELDTQKIIDALMNVERIPRTLLSAKSDDRKAVIAQLQSLNTSLQALATTAKDAAGPTALLQRTATSSDEAVRIRATDGAPVLQTDVIVDRIATAHSIVTGSFTAATDDPLVFTVVRPGGEPVEVRPASGKAADIAQALTAAGAGVTASAVSAGVDAEGRAQWRLQVTATETGAAAAFQVFRGDAAAVAAGTASDLATEPGGATVTAGADAQVRLWAGTAAEQTVTSASNTFTQLFAGVEVTVSRATTTPATLSVAADTTKSTAAAKAFVGAVGTLLAGIARGSTATAASAPGEQTRLGVFTGDSTVRSLNQAMTAAVQLPIDGVSPATAGISVDRRGVVTLDEKAFTAALAADPVAVQRMFAGVAERVQDVAERYSDKYDGLLTSRITGQESEVRMLGEQLSRWDLRLEQRRATLERTYASMETMLSRLQSQSSYLESQLSGLSGSGSNK